MNNEFIGKYSKMVLVISFFFIIGLFFCTFSIDAEPIIADHEAAANFENIPDEYLSSVHDDFHIYYGHTSHGSQIMTGIHTIELLNSSYDPPFFHEVGDDLGHNGDVSWVPDIRNYLDATPACNMVMMSWCGGCSDNTEEGINTYLDAFTQLELDYPQVTFVYMTGHLDGTGAAGNLYARNNQIRAFCNVNDKILFDFADIESWDPDGNYYPDDSDACNWCYEWCSSNDCPECGCAHSHCFNCYLKGKAWWWMTARVSGWNQTGGNDTIPPTVSIVVPKHGLYLNNQKLFPLFTTVIIGFVEVQVMATDVDSGISQIEFFVDGTNVATSTNYPYQWLWDSKSFKIHTLQVIAYDSVGNQASDEISLLKIL
ncbi:MAG: hypothetical protein KKC68_05875 [Candidatus Thermoplasmatota archaeon]|nr:hypothetical protein [Candidatus Thermoplasmatota archaeon]MBU1941285.1 hypothetical protein [Candidatus Thermoplasmatota archaeon]